MAVKFGKLFEIDATMSGVFARLPLIGQAHVSKITGASFDSWRMLKRTGEV